MSRSTRSSYVWVRLFLSEVVWQSSTVRVGILITSHRWGPLALYSSPSTSPSCLRPTLAVLPSVSLQASQVESSSRKEDTINSRDDEQDDSIKFTDTKTGAG